MRTRPVGDRGLLLECEDAASAAAAAAVVRGLPGVVEVVPAARTVLVLAASVRRLAALRGELEDLPEPGRGDSRAGPEVVVDVVYDGADLPALADGLGMSVEGLVARHTAEAWTSAFIGFAPGFAYLEGSGALPEVPRRSEPRTSVPAGAVALAGPWSAVYPTASPGGWQLVGRTDRAVWDPARTPPALLLPGTRVRFRAVRGTVDARAGTGAAGDDAGRTRTTVPAGAPGPVGAATPRGPGGTLEVVATGPLALVEDLGRPGLLDVGVPRAGALDRGAAVRANRLVGNARDAAVVEVTLGGLVVRADGHLVVAVTGAPVGLEVVAPADESPGPAAPAPDDVVLARPAMDAPFAVPDGAALVVGTPEVGVRSYLAVRGGLDAPTVLGSRAVDLLSRLGAPLAAGDRVPVGPPPGDAVAAGPDPVPAPARRPHRVRVLPGPRADRLDPAGPPVTGRPWTVLDASNRVGLRLDGPPLRTLPGELASEGTVPGAVQVPPSGRPVVFLADHPVTGGYPVVAVVVADDLDLLAQVRPGEQVVLVDA